MYTCVVTRLQFWGWQRCLLPERVILVGFTADVFLNVDLKFDPGFIN